MTIVMNEIITLGTCLSMFVYIRVRLAEIWYLNKLNLYLKPQIT